MSWQCGSVRQGSVCVNAWEGPTPAPDCAWGPGLNLWNLYNLGWTVSSLGWGLYQTPAWGNAFNGSISIVPRSRPDLSGYRGIFVPAHADGGYMVELDAPYNADAGVPLQVTIRRVFSNNSIPFLVKETGGTQTDYAHPFVDNSEGPLRIALTSLNSNPPSATVSVSYSPGPGTWWNQDFGYPTVNNPSVGDWSPGYYKGQCWPGQGIAGVSRFDNGAIASHGMLCGQRTLGLSPDQTWETPSTDEHFMNMLDYDNRCDTDNGWDWDQGSYKLECCSNEIVSGISQDANGLLVGVLCEKAGVSHSSCDTQVFYNHDSPGFSGFDWDPGYYKGQCPAGQYVAGISTPAYASIGPWGAAHAILCCSP
jgi:hypothetical protein